METRREKWQRQRGDKLHFAAWANLAVTDADAHLVTLISQSLFNRRP